MTFRIFLVLILLAIFSTACQGNVPAPISTLQPTFTQPSLDLGQEGESASVEETPVDGEQKGESSDAEKIPYPIMDDAEDVEDFFGLYSYKTEYSVEDVVSFYIDHLESEGYSLTADTHTSTFAVMQFKKDSKIITLNVSDAGGGQNEVKLADADTD